MRPLIGWFWLTMGLFVCGLTLALPKYTHGHALLPQQQLVTHTIRYRNDLAGEVTLVWGIDGWQAVPAEQQPAGTVVQKKLMYTPMQPTPNGFVARVKVPAGSIIDYAFQITRASSGASVSIWDANGDPKRDYHTYAVQSGIAEITADARVRGLIEPPAATSGLNIWVVAGVGALVLVGLIALLRRRFRRPFMDF